MPTVEERFWAKVRKADGDACWEWTAGVGTHGYGRLGVGRELVFAHRFSWELHNGPIPDGQCVLHHCDNRRCVRPDHLFLGTRGDNARDMASKGRQHLQVNPTAMAGDKHWTRRRPELVKRGEAHARSRLTEVQVVQIRERFAAGAMYSTLASDFNVSEGTIAFIVTGQTWRHAGGPVSPPNRCPRRSA